MLGAFYANPCHVSANLAQVLAMLKGTGPLISRLLKEVSRPYTNWAGEKGHLAMNKNVIRSWKSFFSSQLTCFFCTFMPRKIKTGGVSIVILVFGGVMIQFVFGISYTQMLGRFQRMWTSRLKTVDSWTKKMLVLLMDEILHQLIGSISYHLQGFYTSQVVVWDFWTINSM